MHRASTAYVQTQVTTTGQGEIVVLLFTGAISFLNQAKEAINEKLYEKKGNLISKALDILNELESTLNMEKGGDLAKNLHILYSACSQKLVLANIRMNTQYIDEVITVLSSLRDGFASIVDDPAAKEAAQQIAIKQQPSQAEQRKVPNFVSQSNFTSSARASSLYAKKTAEMDTESIKSAAPMVQTPATLQKESPSLAKVSTTEPQISSTKVETSFSHGQKTQNQQYGKSQEKIDNIHMNDNEESLVPDQKSSSFSGGSTFNKSLYQKFSSFS